MGMELVNHSDMVLLAAESTNMLRPLARLAVAENNQILI